MINSVWRPSAHDLARRSSNTKSESPSSRSFSDAVQKAAQREQQTSAGKQSSTATPTVEKSNVDSESAEAGEGTNIVAADGDNTQVATAQTSVKAGAFRMAELASDSVSRVPSERLDTAIVSSLTSSSQPADRLSATFVAGRSSTEQILKIDELSNTMHRLHLQSASQAPKSINDSALGTAFSTSAGVSTLRAAELSTGRWNIDLPGNAHNVQSVQLALSSDGHWSVTINMLAQSTARPSGRSLVDLQDALTERGHQIDELRIAHHSDDSAES